MNAPDAPPTFVYRPGVMDEVRTFLKQMRERLRTGRLVRVWEDRLEAYDVNGDSFVIEGLGYTMPEVVEVLDALNAAYKKAAIHEPTTRPYKEFKTGRRYPWAADRVM